MVGHPCPIRARIWFDYCLRMPTNRPSSSGTVLGGSIRANPLTTHAAQDRQRTDHNSFHMGKQTPYLRMFDDVPSFGSYVDMGCRQRGRRGDSKLASDSVGRKHLVEPLEHPTDTRNLTSFYDAPLLVSRSGSSCPSSAAIRCTEMEKWCYFI